MIIFFVICNRVMKNVLKLSLLSVRIAWYIALYLNKCSDKVRQNKECARRDATHCVSTTNRKQEPQQNKLQTPTPKYYRAAQNKFVFFRTVPI